MNKEELLQQYVVKEFSSEFSVKRYSKQARAGLWGSEEKLIKQYFKKLSSVLDVGCGTGRTSTALYRMGYKVTGLDITPIFIEIARANAKKAGYAIRYILGDATSMHLLSESFDNALFSFNGWLQIPGKQRRFTALQEIRRVMRPGGRFILTTHIRVWRGYERLWLRKAWEHFVLKPVGLEIEGIDFGDIFFEQGARHQKQYTHIPSLSSVKRMLKRAGFRIILMRRRNTIAPADSKLKSDNCMFFVCEKL